MFLIRIVNWNGIHRDPPSSAEVMGVIPVCWVKTRCTKHLLEDRGYMRSLEHRQTQPRPKRKRQVWFRWLILPAFRSARVYLTFAYICNYYAWPTFRGTVGKTMLGRGLCLLYCTLQKRSMLHWHFPLHTSVCRILSRMFFMVLLKWQPVSKDGTDFSDLTPETRQ
jgi:hypothetical protein